MAPRPGTLVLDDGELGDVRAALEQIGVEYTYLRGGASDGIRVEAPGQLLVATPRRALKLARGNRDERNPGPAPVRIVVSDQDSVGLRDQLRGVGFDYLVRRPIHPGALRLVLLRALYRGPERRVTVRYPIGGPVQYRIGLRRRNAVLLEVSLRGCRIQTQASVEPDVGINVILPKDFTGGRSLSLAGWVVRCEPSPDGEHEWAIAFETLKSSSERALRALLKRKIQGLGTGTNAGPAAASSELTDRRDKRRGAVIDTLRIQDQAARALVGRNLSTGGMLVEQNLDLRLGDETSLEIYGREGDDPIPVMARVVRDDEQGMALQFIDVSESHAARLEALVAGLPSIERLADTEAEAMGTVVAHILENE